MANKNIIKILFFQIYFEDEAGRIYNNESIITTDNWNELKDTFFTQRMERYPANDTLQMKIDKELFILESIRTKKVFDDLINWYKEYLSNINIQSNPQEPTETPLFIENKFDRITPRKVEAFFKKELVDAGYLSIENLQKFLVTAFQEESVPAEKITFEKRIKAQDARDIFYRYYTVIAKAGNSNKMKYAELLGNHFEGFTAQKVFDNFAK